MPVSVHRKDIQFTPDSSRVIARLFMPGKDRAEAIIRKILEMKDMEVSTTLNQVLREFSGRHRNITKIYEKHFSKVRTELNGAGIPFDSLTDQQKLLLGSYFTFEYSIESAAFFNPSMVLHPDQANLAKGHARVIISFRATGEGHISSLVFRSGELDAENNFTLYPVGKRLDEAEVVTRHVYNKKRFRAKLDQMHNRMDIVDLVADKLNDEFIYGELQAAIIAVQKEIKMSHSKTQAIKHMQWLANSHYEITFSRDTAISERVIFPISYTERNGIEDARFVRFTHDTGNVTYYGTYTAYDGTTILPKLIRTADFCHFKVMPLNGERARNKNFALFPRKIKGKFAMISRLDGINNYLMFSERVNLWQEAELLQEPAYPWEFIQIGNAGSPIETAHGWLMVSHGVGPMRKYCLGATLLDLDNPRKVIGRTVEPILSPNSDEREGYVPNVVYSCGSIVHSNELVIPYAKADYASSIASIPLEELFAALLPAGRKPPSQPPPEKNSSCAILLIDDDPTSLKLISRYLVSGSCKVSTAAGGAEALKLLADNRYDIILSDIMMPHMDGLEFLETIKKRRIETPVILFTSNASTEMELKGLQLGAVDFIRKPLTKDILLLRIKKILQNHA